MIRSKSTAVILSIVVSGLLLWPVTENLKKTPVDRFPLSYYPMFSYSRGNSHTLNYITGYDSNNTRFYISYNNISSGGFNQARRQLNKAVRIKTGDAFLQKVKKRIKRKDPQLYHQLVRIEIVKGSFDFNTYYLLGDKQPKNETILYTATLQ